VENWREGRVNRLISLYLFQTTSDIHRIRVEMFEMTESKSTAVCSLVENMPKTGLVEPIFSAVHEKSIERLLDIADLLHGGIGQQKVRKIR